MIKTEFGFFQIVVKFLFGDPIELGQSSFRERPKRLDPINVPAAPAKVILAVIHSVMLVITDINKSIVATASYRCG